MPVQLYCDKLWLHRTATHSKNLDVRNISKWRNYDLGYRVVWTLCAVLNVDLGPTNRVMVKSDSLLKVALKGQHLAVRCGRFHSSPWHHAIYGGFDAEGRGWVYHMAGVEKRKAHIRRDLFLDFARGQLEVAIVIYDDDKPDYRKRHLETADYFFHHSPREHLYDLVRFNCEHFAILCKTGRYRTAIFGQSKRTM